MKLLNLLELLIKEFINLFKQWGITNRDWKIYRKNGMKYVEDYDYYSLTTAFMINELKNELKNEGGGFEGKICLSVGCKIGYLVVMLPLFKKVIHSTMEEMCEKEEVNKIFENKIMEVCGDFMQLAEEESLKEVEVVLSHATIHCMQDSRYGNKFVEGETPYCFSNKLSSICPNAKHIIVSVPVNDNDNIVDNGSWLCDQKFIDSFVSNGYRIQAKLYDKNCLAQNLYDVNDRVSREFPREYAKNHAYIIGNYHFVKI